MTCWEKLPPEILVMIFEYYVSTNSQKDLMYCVAEVCTSWRNACLDTQLWKTFDGTLTVSKLLNFCKRGVLINTTKLYFPKNCEKPSSETMDKILREMPNLRYINLNAIHQFPKDFFHLLAKYGKKLNEIDFSGAKSINDLYMVQSKHMEEFFSACGLNLLSLNLSGRRFSSLQSILKRVLEFCPNLQEFICLNSSCKYDASHAKVTISISEFQKQCPKLNVLRITPHFIFSSKKSDSESTDGFPDLEVLTMHSDNLNELLINDASLSSLLFKSTKLKVLDIRGSYYITASCLAELPATDLEYLYLSNTHILHPSRLDKISLRNMFEKWRHSLKVLDISRFRDDYVNDVVLILASQPDSKLETLNVTETRIIIDSVYKILTSFPNLKQLNLESCRNLGRGMKRSYNGKFELQSLFNRFLSGEKITQCD
ncbi:F-box/LRR-repeat protein 6-like [Uloborus diversus]|uniref:F-box/LRR-repeat protein 6-like n=1 Tax=Uloborus diversus TaxID=327109 RepID=UPI00240A652F|nr:F-box/LRR-repeat protein 6-like [Uloborus diversus]